LVDPGRDGRAGEFDICFIDDHRRVRRGFENSLDGIRLEERPSGIVGIGDEQDARFFAKSGAHAREREFHLGAVALDFNARAENLGVIAVHRERRLTNENVAASIHEGVEEDAQSVVAAVGEHQLFGSNAKVPRQPFREHQILGIHGELLRRDFRQRAENCGGAARGILVKIEANFAKSAFCRRFVGAPVKNSLANGEFRFHRRTSTALA